MGWEGWPPTPVVIVTLVLGIIFEIVFCIGFWQFWCVRSDTREPLEALSDCVYPSIAGRAATPRSLWRRQPRPRAMQLKQLQVPPKICWRTSLPHRQRAVGKARRRASSGGMDERARSTSACTWVACCPIRTLRPATLAPCVSKSNRLQSLSVWLLATR